MSERITSLWVTDMEEAASKIPEFYKASHPRVPWQEVKAFRNYVIHEYFGLDDDIIRDIIQHDLPELHEEIGRLKEE